MRKSFRFLFLIITAYTLTGCAHRGPGRIALPSTAAVRKPLAAAQAANVQASLSNARISKLAAKALAVGIKPQSQEARDLSSAAFETARELTTVKVQLAVAQASVDQLTAQLLADQRRVDALSRHDAAETARANRETLAAGRLLKALILTTAGWLAAVLCAGCLLESLFRGVLSWCVATASRLCHQALTLLLRLWPLILAAFA